VKDEAARICRNCLESGLFRGRSIDQIMASSLYAACREREAPATIAEVAAVSGVDRDDVARCYRLLVGELNLVIPIADPAEYVARVAYRANVSPKVETDAREMLSKAWKAGVTGGVNPTGLAASAVYMASINLGEKMTEKCVADAAGVAESTVARENKRLRSVLGVAERNVVEEHIDASLDSRLKSVSDEQRTRTGRCTAAELFID
jgi:transcription initiation factor TFIIB